MSVTDNGRKISHTLKTKRQRNELNIEEQHQQTTLYLWILLCYIIEADDQGVYKVYKNNNKRTNKQVTVWFNKITSCKGWRGGLDGVCVWVWVCFMTRRPTRRPSVSQLIRVSVGPYCHQTIQREGGKRRGTRRHFEVINGRLKR